MTRQEELIAALAKAEVALVNAVTNATTVDSVRTEADAEVVKARAHCRWLRAALVELNRSESIAGSGERTDTRIKQLEDASKRSATASRPSRQPSEHTVRGENKRSRNGSRQGKPIRRFNIGFSAQEPSPGDALARPPLLRQSSGLLALTLAYLLYFHVDVQLQILSLPTTFL